MTERNSQVKIIEKNGDEKKKSFLEINQGNNRESINFGVNNNKKNIIERKSKEEIFQDKNEKKSLVESDQGNNREIINFGVNNHKKSIIDKKIEEENENFDKNINEINEKRKSSFKSVQMNNRESKIFTENKSFEENNLAILERKIEEENINSQNNEKIINLDEPDNKHYRESENVENNNFKKSIIERKSKDYQKISLYQSNNGIDRQNEKFEDNNNKKSLIEIEGKENFTENSDKNIENKISLIERNSQVDTIEKKNCRLSRQKKKFVRK